MNGNAVAAHPQSAGNSVNLSRSIGAEDPSAASTANGETNAQAKDSMDLSGLSNHELDLIIANLEARALERRNKIRKIEALSEELGLSVRQQNWVAFLNRPSPEPGRSIVIGERDCNHERIQAESAAAQNVEPVPISEASPTHDSVAVMDDGSANSFSNVQAEPETPLRSQRLLRGHERTRGQLERNTDRHEDEEDEEIHEVNRPHSIVHSQTVRSRVNVNEGFRQRNSSADLINGVAKRTAWSIVIETHPEEIATNFRAGERPTNKQVNSMVGVSKSRQHQRSPRLNARCQLDLPAVNRLVNNPMRNKRTHEWHIRGLSQPRQIQRLVSILIQITGEAAPDPCETCQKGCGLWTGCYLRPADARGVTAKVCANCMYNNKSTRCRWKQGPALP